MNNTQGNHGSMRPVIFAAFMLLYVLIGRTQTPILNEIMTSNDLIHYDDFLEFDDWVEIYNPGGLIQLSGYHLSDDPENLTKYTIPDTDPGTTFLPPGDHMIIWLDKDSAQGVLHANFKLSSENEGLWLTEPDGMTVLDSLVYPPQQTDISYGRSCDGCDTWEYFNVPTPEAENFQTAVPTPFLYINEVLLENTSVLVDELFEFEPWLEIYNPNASQVNLGGYTIGVLGGDSYTLPNDNPVETTIEGEGFLLLWLDGEPEEGGHHLDLVPNVESQTIWLIGPDMVVADEYHIETTVPNVSFGREFDGAGNFVFFDTPTPRVTNSLVIVPPAPVVINECVTYSLGGLLDDAGELEDWVEIHNLSEEAIDLSGYYLTDRLNNPTKWRVPIDAGSDAVIEPQGYLLLWADDDSEQGWNHMKFRLNNDGESLVLRSPDGFTIADSVHFGASQPDDSYARIPNGTGSFEWGSNPTPNQCNDCTESVSSWTPTSERIILGSNLLTGDATIQLRYPAFLRTLDGREVAQMPAGTSVLPEGLFGVYVLVDSKIGRVERLVVLSR